MGFEECIGTENKDEIRTLKEKIKLFELEITHIKGTMVTNQALNKLELEMVELKGSIQEIKNNRKEDRESIKALSTSIEEVSARLEEYLENNAKVLANQIIQQRDQKDFGKALEQIAFEMKNLHQKIDDNNISKQVKKFYEKNKVNRWIIRISGVLLAILLVSIFSFFTSGGETFFDIVKKLRELI